MAYTGLTPDSTTNGVDFVTTAKTGLTATITNEVLQLSGGSARLNGGIAISKSSISCYDPLADNGGNRGPSALLGFSTNNTITGSSPRVTITGSSLSVETVFGRKSGLLISDVVDSLITETGPGGWLIIRVQPACTFVNSIFEGIEVLEFAGAITQFFNVSIRNSRSGILNWEAGRLDFVGIQIPSSTSGYLATVGDGPDGNTNTNALHFWNPAALDFTKLLLCNDGSKAYQGSTVSWKIKASSPVENAIVIYRDDRASVGGAKSEIGRYVTNSSGILTGTVDSKTGTTGSDTMRPTLWVRNKQTRLTGSTQAQSPQVVYTFWDVGGQYGERLYAVDTVASEIEIRSYLHLKPDLVMSPTSEIGKIKADGSVDFYADFVLSVDTGVTVTNTSTVGSYAGITNAAGAITLTGTLTLSQAYDSRKLYWRNNDGVSCPVQDGFTADFGSANITLSAAANNPAPTAKYTAATTTGSLTLSAAGNYSTTPWTRPSGTTTTVAAGSTNLLGWTLTGSTINVSSGSATVTVDSVSGITAGSDVTLQEPQIQVTAVNFANDTRVQVAHRQVFTIASTAINTTADVLTLGNDSNGDAANFRATSPNTLIRFSLASGATIPASSPQVFDGGLYYWKSGGQLSVAEGGSAINFSTQGSGNFVLIAETEIDNSVVSGGAGYAFALSRSNNARIRVKAVHWANPSSIAACSTFFDRVFAWSTVAGISILDTVNNAVAASQDSIHEQLIAISSINLEGPVIDATGATITAITLPNDGSAVTGFSLALEGTGKIQINSNDVDGVTSWQELYLWGCYVRSTAAGIRLASASTFVANSIFNFAFENLEFDNTSSTPLAIVGGIGRSANGANPVAATTTGSIALNAVSQGTGAVVPTGSGLDAAGVRSAIGLAAANLDTQLDNLPTVSELNARTLPSADLTAIKTQTDKFVFTTTGRVDAGVIDKTGFSLTQTFPTNFASLAITGGGAVTAGTVSDKAGYSLSSSQSFNLTGNITGNLSGSVGSVTGAVILPALPTDWISAAGVSAAAVTKIQNGLSTYAGGDTSGTTTLLSRLTNARAGLLDNLDATISSRSTYSGGDTPGTATLLSRITGAPLLASNYTAPNNAGIAAIQAKTDQMVFTTANRLDSTAIGVPTNPLLTSDSRLNNLDEPIGSRMATFTYTAPPTVSQIWTGFTSGTVATNLITQFQSGLFQTTSYTAPNNAGILSAISALPQDKTGYSLSASQTFNLTGNISGSVGSVTGAITLPALPVDWISAVSISAAAVTKIQNGLSTYAGGDTSGTSTLLTRLTSTRAGYLDNLAIYTAPDNAGITSIQNVLAAIQGSGFSTSTDSLKVLSDSLDTKPTAANVRTELATDFSNLEAIIFAS